MSWTDERIQELERLWQQGMSASEIGKRLGVSKNAIVGKAHRMNLPSRPSPIRNGEEGEMVTNGAAEPQPRAARKSSGKSSGGKQSKSNRSASGANGSSGGNGKAKSASTQGNPASVRAQVEARGGRSGCLWPIGDPNDPDFHFCGASAQPGKPYCTEHAQRAYITRSRGERDEEAA
jgi:GcrA cell cycle regulator